MKTINVNEIIKTVKELSIEANYYLPNDVKEAIEKAEKNEKWPIANNILNKILENSQIASAEKMPICQDTGMACVFIDIGQDVHITGGSQVPYGCRSRPQRGKGHPPCGGLRR